MSEEETNYQRREVIFDFIRNAFKTTEFTLIAAWKEINNSEILGDLYSDLDVRDVHNWFCEATIDDGNVPPEVSLEVDSIDVGCRKYSMLGTCESMERWRPRLRIQLELKKLALSKLYEDSIYDRDEDADRSSNDNSELLETDSEESFKLTNESVESSKGASASHDELEVSSEVERTISEAVENARSEFHLDSGKESMCAETLFRKKSDGAYEFLKQRTTCDANVESNLETWVRHRFLDGNLVYDECGNRVPGVRFGPFFYRGSGGAYEYAGIEVVPFSEKSDGTSFEEVLDALAEDLVRDLIDESVKTVGSSGRIEFLGCERYDYEHLRPRGWNGPGWYVWDAPQWKVCGPFETEVLASEWWNEVKRRAEKKSIDVDGLRKLVFYSPFGHEVEVKGWSGSGYYFWADDGSAVHGPYDSEFSASNARDEYEKVLERKMKR